MICVESCQPWQLPERNPAIEGFVYWRGKLEQMRCSRHRDGMVFMLWSNHIVDYRHQLAPWEWIWRPDWDRLTLRAELRLVPEPKVEGEQ